jgi:AsmA protein
VLIDTWKNNQNEMVFFRLIAAVVVIIVIVPMVVNPNDFKPEIVEAVKSSTGRDLVIRDDMNLSVFPSVAIQLSGVSLSNAAGFSPENMAAVGAVDLKVAVMPLLSGSVEVDTVIVPGLELNLAKDKNGKTNWSDLSGGETTSDDTDDDGQTGGAADLAVQIKGIAIENATLTWDDKQAGTHYEIGNLSLKTDAIASSKDVPVDLGVTLTSASPKESVNIELSSTVTANENLTQISIADLIVALAATGEGLPSGGLDLALKGAINLDRAAGTVAISDLALNGADVTLTGALSGSDLNGSPKLPVTLSLPSRT